jgi:hypothetical protein
MATKRKASKTPSIKTAERNGVIRVGEGRGFMVEGKRQCFVITAAHCLPQLPPCHRASLTQERSYAKLLGPVGGERTVWTECLYVDPIADLAVPGSPDNQVLIDEAEAYEAFVDGVTPLPIADLPLTREPVKLNPVFFSGKKMPGTTIPGPPKWEGSGKLLSLDGRWFPCKLRALSRGICVYETAEPIRGGMSGSPILTEAGAAVGVVSTSSGIGSSEGHTEGSAPFLMRELPRWIIEEIGAAHILAP